MGVLRTATRFAGSTTAKAVGLDRPVDQGGAFRLAARAVVGGLFIGHGTQKLFGWFGGPGQEGTRQMMSALEMGPPEQHAFMAGALEAGGGALLALGLGTPVAASSLIGVMTTAIRKVHLRNGPWAANGGYEYNLVLIAALAAIVESGPGTFSLDRALGIERRGAVLAASTLALGVAASDAVIRYGRRHAAATAAYPTETSAAEAVGEQPAGDPASAARA